MIEDTVEPSLPAREISKHAPLKSGHEIYRSTRGTEPRFLRQTIEVGAHCVSAYAFNVVSLYRNMLESASSLACSLQAKLQHGILRGSRAESVSGLDYRKGAARRIYTENGIE